MCLTLQRMQVCQKPASDSRQAAYTLKLHLKWKAHQQPGQWLAQQCRTKEDCGQGSWARGLMGDLLLEQVHVVQHRLCCLAISVLASDCDREVAVVAPSLAEGQVDIG